ncbi:MAG: hypothetical protein KGS61_00845 [Verrucomicrobia bacterium]|nr:hypothetical protein [Verrucomicrobiota bacterium]
MGAETERVFKAELSRRLPCGIQRNARRKLLLGQHYDLERVQQRLADRLAREVKVLAAA